MFRYKRKNAELTAKNEVLKRTLKDKDQKLTAALTRCCELEDEIKRLRELHEPQERPVLNSGKFKVPHCAACPDHTRFNSKGKYAHQCNKVGRPISGNDTRTSPTWCPLRTAKKDGDTTVSTAKNTTEKGSVNHDDSTT